MARRSLAWILVIGGLVVVSHTGCDGGPGGGGGVSEASCSSCESDYTEEMCKEWGDLAGCEESGTDTDDACNGHVGCAYKSCKGAPICNDVGSAECASCNGDLTQDDCDSTAEGAGCDSAETQMFTACGNPAVGCVFLGCDYQPSCP